MSPILLFTALPLGLFLIVASIATIRRTWTFLVVGDGFLPGKPSLAMRRSASSWWVSPSMTPCSTCPSPRPGWSVSS